MKYTHPREMAIVLNKLYNHPMMSKELVKEIVVDVLVEDVLERLPIGWRSAYR